jgi:hypothetical protein
MKRGRPLAGIAAGAALAAGALVTARAGAHEVGLSRGDYAVSGTEVRAELIFARKELIGLVAGLDADHDGVLTNGEIDAARGAIEGALVGRVKVQGDGAPCPGTLTAAGLAEQDGVGVRAVYRCAARPRQVTVTLAFLDDLAFGHRHLVRASAGPGVPSIDLVLSQRSPTLSLDLPPEAAAPAPSPPFQRGAIHVLTHLGTPLFLVALLASCSTRRAGLLASGAFALAVVVGLAAGALGVFVPSPRAVAAAVALSLVYAGLDALRAPGPAGERSRWPVALPFGVVHGLGCAAALGGPQAAARLLAFGAGVVLAIAGVAAALHGIRSLAVAARLGRGRAAVGVAVAAVGVVAFFTGRA